MCSLPVLSTAWCISATCRIPQMNRKLWGIALLGAWKGFPPAEAVCCVNGRNYKGIRRECSSGADGKGQSSAGKCSGVGLWAPVEAPWAGYREAWGMQSWKGESQCPWLCTVFSGPSGAHPRQVRSAFAAPAPRACEVSVVVTESSGEGKSHQLPTCSE